MTDDYSAHERHAQNARVRFGDARAGAMHRYHTDPLFSQKIKVVIAAMHEGRPKRPGDSWTAIEKRDAFQDAISAVVAMEIIEAGK